MSDQPMQLFGQTINGLTESTLTEQVCAILQSEIQKGRWQVGERLPSIGQLAQETGISRWPIHHAFEMLAERGFLRLEQRRGAFLASATGRGEGAVGILLLGKEAFPDPVQFPYRHRAIDEILRQAGARNLTTELMLRDRTDDLSTIDLQPTSPFSPRVNGIFCLQPFSHLYQDPLPPNRIPLVFQGPYTMDSQPTVTGDTATGMYNLTRKVIALGHRHIAQFIGQQALEIPAVAERAQAFELAMRDAALPVDRELAERTKATQIEEIEQVRELLRATPDVTAWVCLSRRQAQQVIAAAESIGRSVPEHLSVVCFGDGMILGDPRRQVTCYAPNTVDIVKTCFDVLDMQARTRHCPHSFIMVKPLMIEGDSLAPPPRHEAPKHHLVRGLQPV